jgi:hypothetical protein
MCFPLFAGWGMTYVGPKINIQTNNSHPLPETKSRTHIPLQKVSVLAEVVVANSTAPRELQTTGRECAFLMYVDGNDSYQNTHRHRTALLKQRHSLLPVVVHANLR